MYIRKQKIDTIVTREAKELDNNKKAAIHILNEMIGGFKKWTI